MFIIIDEDSYEKAFYERSFWEKIDKLVSYSKIVIDRPKNTSHPKYPDFVYPLDYGYLKDTLASDGNEIDVWIGSLKKKKAVAIITTVDLLKKDVETKILIGCTKQEINTVLNKMNNQFMSAVIIHRKN